jgi:hypothetical protein
MAADLLKTFQTLVTDKRAILLREEKLVTGLRHVLGRLGYQLEAIAANGGSRPSGKTSWSRSAQAGSRASGAISCPECRRTFALPLHLGRHMSAMHAAGKARHSATPASANGSTGTALEGKTALRRRRMSPAARRAVARRMKAYWRKRKAA